MNITFDKPVKIISRKDKDIITIETTETKVTQIVDSLESQMIVVQTSNFPNVIVVEPAEYASKEFTKEEILNRFKVIIQLLDQRNRAEENNSKPEKETVEEKAKSVKAKKDKKQQPTESEQG